MCVCVCVCKTISNVQENCKNSTRMFFSEPLKSNLLTWCSITLECFSIQFLQTRTFSYRIQCLRASACSVVSPQAQRNLQAPLSMKFSRQEHWSGLPFPPPGALPNPGIKPMSLASPSLAGGFFTIEPPEKPHQTQSNHQNQGCNIVPPYFQIHCSLTCCHNNVIYSKINQSEITSCI